MSQAQPDGYVLGELERLVLACVHSFNDTGDGASAFNTASGSARRLVEIGLLEEDASGLWITDRGREYLEAA